MRVVNAALRTLSHSRASTLFWHQQYLIAHLTDFFFDDEAWVVRNVTT